MLKTVENAREKLEDLLRCAEVQAEELKEDFKTSHIDQMTLATQ